MKIAVCAGERQVVVDVPDLPGAPPHLEDAAEPYDAVPLRPGLYSVLAGGRSFEIALEGSELEEHGSGVIAWVDGELASLVVEDERQRARRAAAGAAAAAGGSNETAVVAAPMPGRVIAVPVEPGAQVERGQTVVVLEAMKMESALAAPVSGTVAEVLVRPGAAVNQRQPLVRITSA